MSDFPPLSPDGIPEPPDVNEQIILSDVRRLTMGEGGVVRTAASGQRIELTNEDRNRIYFYSGDDDEAFVGRIVESTSGSGVTRTIQFGIISPSVSTDDQTATLALRSGSPDGSSYAPGVVIGAGGGAGLGTGPDPEFRIQNSIPLITDGDIELAAGGAVGFGTLADDAIHQTSDGVLEVEIGGSSVAAVNAYGINATGGLVLMVKADTGDPAGVPAGFVYMNTFDKKVRAYDGAAWRDLATW